MNWTGFWSIFFLATIKFSVSTIPGPTLEMSFFQTVLASFAGAATCALVSYFASDAILLFMKKRAQKKKEIQESKGITPKTKRKFTWMNKLVIGIKTKLGKVGICFYAPFFLSVPLGSMVVAKFYGKSWEIFSLVLLGLAVNASITSILVYFVF